MSSAAVTSTGKVWFITGVSSGLGLELARCALRRGDLVAGTLRKVEQFDGFRALDAERALPVLADVTDSSSLEAAVKETVDRFGRIDVLANNAGVGTVGAVEETSAADAQSIFDTNFFGQLNATRAVLPCMRKQRSGHVLSFSAIGGFTGVPGLGVYSAAKAAVDVYSEALAQEVAPLGIRVTVLTLGIFRTQFASGSTLKFVADRIADYDNGPSGKFRGFIGNLSGKQPNDPAKAANVIFDLVHGDKPAPVHLLLGRDALGVVQRKLDSVQKDMKEWESVSASVLFDQ